jgi:hypothetical protein
LSQSLFTLHDPVAQSVEHLTFNQVVAGSIPARITTSLWLSIRCPINLTFSRLGLQRPANRLRVMPITYIFLTLLLFITAALMVISFDKLKGG